MSYPDRPVRNPYCEDFHSALALKELPLRISSRHFHPLRKALAQSSNRFSNSITDSVELNIFFRFFFVFYFFRLDMAVFLSWFRENEFETVASRFA